jgi:nucleoid DNA-binding protein
MLILTARSVRLAEYHLIGVPDMSQKSKPNVAEVIPATNVIAAPAPQVKPKAKPVKARGTGKTDLVTDIKRLLSGTTMGTKLTHRDLEFIFKTVMHAVRARILSGKKVSISGFGSYFIAKRQGRVLEQRGGRRIIVPNYKVIRFKPAAIIRKVINGKTTSPKPMIPGDLCIASLIKKRASGAGLAPKKIVKRKPAPKTVAVSEPQFPMVPAC